MNWWTSIGNSVQALRKGISQGLQWAWNKASITRIITGALTYTANTSFQILEQVLALRKALPALINKPESRKILDSMAYVTTHDVLPLVGLNVVNNTLQTYCRTAIAIDPAWQTAYSVFLTTLTLADYGVKTYTWRQGAQSFVHITTLDSLGPAAFNANSSRPPYTLCVEQKCNAKRKMKGMLREPLILLTNDAFIAAIHALPYVGPFASEAVRVFFNGRYITRLATPELCERHKFQLMMQESILALGLTYELNTLIMDYALQSTIGMPPYLYYRTMRHLLLLLHVNLAANMTLPLVQPTDASLPIDPLNIYEAVCRFIADVLFSGLLKRVPIDFKADKNAKALIPLTPTLRLATRLLNSDLETEHPVNFSYFSNTTNKLKIILLPPIFQSTTGFINDPLLAKYWPVLRSGIISSIDDIKSVGKARSLATIAWAPKSVATALYVIVGLPKKLTRVLLMLSQEEDFWHLMDGLKAWFERHNVTYEVALVKNPSRALHGDNLLPLPQHAVDSPPLRPAKELISHRPKAEQTLPASALITKKSPNLASNAMNPSSLFTTRRRERVHQDQSITPPQLGHNH